MSDQELYNQLREKSWRGELSAHDEARLRGCLGRHPELEADWQAEEALTRTLDKLPPAAVSSNFTARCVHAAERKAAEDKRSKFYAGLWGFRPLGWVPRLAFGAFALGAVIFSYHLFEDTQRAKMVKSVAAISQVAALPGPELLRDFDAIRVLDQAPAADEELLRLMQ